MTNHPDLVPLDMLTRSLTALYDARARMEAKGQTPDSEMVRVMVQQAHAYHDRTGNLPITLLQS